MNEQLRGLESEPPQVIRRPNDATRLEVLSLTADALRAEIFSGTQADRIPIEEIMIGDYHTFDQSRRFQRTDALLRWFVLDHVLTYGEIDTAEFVEAVCASAELEGAFLSFRRHDPAGLESRAWTAAREIDDLLSRPL